MTDKQQIEDMAMLIEDVLEDCHNDDCLHCSYRSGKHYHCSRARTAEALYNANYRQVPEDAVVLTKEELEHMVKAKIECINDMAIITRKETAKEILQEVSKVCGDYQWFKNLCKQYGVEVE